MDLEFRAFRTFWVPCWNAGGSGRSRVEMVGVRIRRGPGKVMMESSWSTAV